MRSFPLVILVATMVAIGACANKSDDGSTGGTVSGPATSSASAEAAAQLGPADLEKLMQKIGPTYQSVRKNLQGGSVAEAGKEAQQLGELFGNVEKFWAQHNKEDAVKWAQQARTYASDVAGSAVGGNPAKATAIAENMGGVCKQCHGTYRESDGEGGYRIKPGVITQ
jgi:cytochrome c556